MTGGCRMLYPHPPHTHTLEGVPSLRHFSTLVSSPDSVIAEAKVICIALGNNNGNKHRNVDKQWQHVKQ